MVARACSPTTQGAVWRIAASLSPAWAYGEFESNVGYKERLCLKKQR